MNRPTKMELTNSMLVWNKIGPGLIPCRVNAANIIAVVELPGIPKVIRGTIAPPTDALFADSGAAIPLIIPVPYFSGLLENR